MPSRQSPWSHAFVVFYCSASCAPVKLEHLDRSPATTINDPQGHWSGNACSARRLSQPSRGKNTQLRMARLATGRPFSKARISAAVSPFLPIEQAGTVQQPDGKALTRHPHHFIQELALLFDKTQRGDRNSPVKSAIRERQPRPIPDNKPLSGSGMTGDSHFVSRWNSTSPIQPPRGVRYQASYSAAFIRRAAPSRRQSTPFPPGRYRPMWCKFRPTGAPRQ